MHAASGVTIRWAKSSGPPSAGAPKFQAKKIKKIIFLLYSEN